MRRAMIFALCLLAPAARAEGVTIQVHFDTASRTALTKAGERVVLSGYFYGEPAPDAKMQADEVGQIYLSGEEYTILPVDQPVTFGQTLAKAPVDQVVEPYLNVNIYSARFTSDENLLDCEIVDDSVKILGASVHVLNCKLIGG